MKVSIITACYNRERTISSAIESVLSQTYDDLEYIIVDGQSKDKSFDVINQYKENIDVIICEKDTGMYNAINKGIIKATGDIVGLLHSDDFFYDNTTIQKIVTIFDTTDADIVYANGLYVDEDDTAKIKRVYRAKVFKSRYLYFGWIPLHTTIFVKREIFEKFGLYKEDFKIASDYEISLRWFKNNQLKKIFMNDWVVKMRLGGKSTDLTQQKLKSEEDLKIIKQYKLFGKLTLLFKIVRKVPQYIFPMLIKYK